MAISNSMKFTIHTLIDVTKTDVRRHEHPKLVNQQANFNTLYNTIGLRTNPINFIVTQELTALNKYNFGSKYKNKQRVWTVEFEVEADYSTAEDLMQTDFDMVPFIAGLDETINLENKMFVTSDEIFTNILFLQTDK
tara:strand:+ start:96 stop:506 length:411 start_codon:yes stop_codon:yes gene_type:complete